MSRSEADRVRSLAVWASGCLLLLGTACTPEATLDEVPISGGTHEQRETVREAARWFDEATGHGRLTLREIVITAEPGENPRYAGLYHRGTVFLSDGDFGEKLSSVAVHEFCHGLDDDLGRPSQHPSIVEASEDARPDTSFPTSPDTHNPREVFARICEAGPVGTKWLTHPCPGDSTHLRDAAAVVNDAVWRSSPDVHLRRDDVRSLHAARVDGEIVTLGSYGLRDEPAAYVYALLRPYDERLEDAGTDGFLRVDFADHELGPSPGDGFQQDYDVDPSRYDTTPPYNMAQVSPFRFGISTPAIVARGREVVVMRQVGGHKLGLNPRPMAHVDGEWHEIGGACANETSAIAHADGRFYVFTARDGEISWAETSFP